MELKDFATGTYGTMYYVRDMNKAIAYYTALLGKAPADTSPEWTTFKLGDASLCLHGTEGKNVEGKDIFGKGVLIMNAKNLKDSIPALKAMGVEIETDYHSVCEGGYAIDVRDPSGNLISFFEYTGV